MRKNVPKQSAEEIIAKRAKKEIMMKKIKKKQVMAKKKRKKDLQERESQESLESQESQKNQENLKEMMRTLVAEMDKSSVAVPVAIVAAIEVVDKEEEEVAVAAEAVDVEVVKVMMAKDTKIPMETEKEEARKEDTTHGKAKKERTVKDREAEVEETQDLHVPSKVSNSEMDTSKNQRLQEVMAMEKESHTVETAETVDTEVEEEEEEVEVVEVEAAETVNTTLMLPTHHPTKLKIDNSEEKSRLKSDSLKSPPEPSSRATNTTLTCRLDARPDIDRV